MLAPPTIGGTLAPAPNGNHGSEPGLEEAAVSQQRTRRASTYVMWFLPEHGAKQWSCSCVSPMFGHSMCAI